MNPTEPHSTNLQASPTAAQRPSWPGWALYVSAAAVLGAVYWLLRREKIIPSILSLITGQMKYFTIKELCRSDTASRFHLDNTPPPEAEKNLQQLINRILDPAREAYGRPVYVNSGYRSPEVNSKVHGSPGSKHTTGQAADITTKTRAGNVQLWAAIHNSNLPYYKMIWERDGQWIHVSYTGEARREMLAWNGGTAYARINGNWQNVVK